MKQNNVEEITQYIKTLEPNRKQAFEKLRKLCIENLPQGFEEGFTYNMLAYFVPKSIYPAGYHCDSSLPLPFINIASQKNFIALYHMGLYANEDIKNWFETEYPKHSKYKLDMGKSCIRFKKMDDIPYTLIAGLLTKFTVESWITTYESNFRNTK